MLLLHRTRSRYYRTQVENCVPPTAAASMDRQARDAQRETGNRIPHMLTGCFRGMPPTSEPACEEMGWSRGTISIHLRTRPARQCSRHGPVAAATDDATVAAFRNQPSPHSLVNGSRPVPPCRNPSRLLFLPSVAPDQILKRTVRICPNAELLLGYGTCSASTEDFISFVHVEI